MQPQSQLAPPHCWHEQAAAQPALELQPSAQFEEQWHDEAQLLVHEASQAKLIISVLIFVVVVVIEYLSQPDCGLFILVEMFLPFAWFVLTAYALYI